MKWDINMWKKRNWISHYLLKEVLKVNFCLSTSCCLLPWVRSKKSLEKAQYLYVEHISLIPAVAALFSFYLSLRKIKILFVLQEFPQEMRLESRTFHTFSACNKEISLLWDTLSTPFSLSAQKTRHIFKLADTGVYTHTTCFIYLLWASHTSFIYYGPEVWKHECQNLGSKPHTTLLTKASDKI